jgi:hypothetical protein
MGSYASLIIKDFDFYSCKSYIEPELMTLYRESDKTIHTWIDEDEEVRHNVKYTNSVRNIKLRLDIMGFTLKNAEMDFSKHNNTIQTYFDFDDDEFNECDLVDYTFSNWLNAMKNIDTSSLDIWKLKDGFFKENKKNTIEYHILDEHFNGGPIYGFATSDIRYVLRGILELFDDNDECSLDYTDLVDGGYYEETEEVCKSSLDYLSSKSLSNQKIIILTEGSSDISVIQRTMKLLYPDLLDYYSFMDFNISNASGSANSLVSYIKVFIGSGINNKIIALFDNDTAAFDAVKVLNKVNIPNNIKVLHYPDLEIAKSYPTLGPGGTLNCDINGLACSIELYLGNDILLGEDNKLTPIQWKGYNQALKKYQGEILNKELLTKRYYQLLDDIENNIVAMEQHDWDGMNKIFTMIFEAFH